MFYSLLTVMTRKHLILGTLADNINTTFENVCKAIVEKITNVPSNYFLFSLRRPVSQCDFLGEANALSYIRFELIY